MSGAENGVHKFCRQCGAQLESGDRFCQFCGAATAAATPPPPRLQAQAQAQTAPPPPKRKRRIWPYLVTTVVVLSLAFVIGAGVGIVTGLDAAASIDGTDAATIIDRHGEPSSFWLVDGPGTPGGDDQLRFEQWMYPEDGVVVTFSNGILMSEEQVTFSQELGETQVSPTELSRHMDRENVEAMLGEQGEPLEAVDSPYQDLEAFGYPRSRLLIGYLDGMFFSAQVY